MPNFDSFERLFKEALAGKENQSSKFSIEISHLPEAQKVKVVKGRSQHEVSEFLDRGRSKLRSFFSDDPVFTSSNDNKIGKDLLEINSGIEVELKSGPSQTDGNPGLATVAWALDDEVTTLSHIMSDSMKVRRELYIKGKFDEIEKSKKLTMDSLFQYFKSKIAQDTEPPPKLEHFVRCVSVGFTKRKEIEKSYNTSSINFPLLLQADWQEGLVVYEKSFLPQEKLRISQVVRTGRAQIVVEGTKSLSTATIYPNYKNSWHSSDKKIYIPAENWVKNACFQVWIKGMNSTSNVQ